MDCCRSNWCRSAWRRSFRYKPEEKKNKNHTPQSFPLFIFSSPCRFDCVLSRSLPGSCNDARGSLIPVKEWERVWQHLTSFPLFFSNKFVWGGVSSCFGFSILFSFFSFCVVWLLSCCHRSSLLLLPTQKKLCQRFSRVVMVRSFDAKWNFHPVAGKRLSYSLSCVCVLSLCFSCLFLMSKMMKGEKMIRFIFNFLKFWNSFSVSGNETLGGDSSVHSTYVQYVDGSPDSALYAATNGQMWFPITNTKNPLPSHL